MMRDLDGHVRQEHMLHHELEKNNWLRAGHVVTARAAMHERAEPSLITGIFE